MWTKLVLFLLPGEIASGCKLLMPAAPSRNHITSGNGGRRRRRRTEKGLGQCSDFRRCCWIGWGECRGHKSDNCGAAAATTFFSSDHGCGRHTALLLPARRRPPARTSSFLSFYVAWKLLIRCLLLLQDGRAWSWYIHFCRRLASSSSSRLPVPLAGCRQRRRLYSSN